MHWMWLVYSWDLIFISRMKIHSLGVWWSLGMALAHGCAWIFFSGRNPEIGVPKVAPQF